VLPRSPTGAEGHACACRTEPVSDTNPITQRKIFAFARRSRILPMTDELCRAVQALRHLRGPRVLYRDDGSSLTNKVVRLWMLAAQRRAGLPVRNGGTHILRHTFCSHLAMQGAAAKAIQELAGHSALAMTQRYMHLSPAAKDSAIALLNARPVESVNVRGTSLAPAGVPQANPNDLGWVNGGGAGNRITPTTYINRPLTTLRRSKVPETTRIAWSIHGRTRTTKCDRGLGAAPNAPSSAVMTHQRVQAAIERWREMAWKTKSSPGATAASNSKSFSTVGTLRPCSYRA